MRIALAQINAVIGDFGGNADRMFAFVEKGLAENADLIVFPELSLIGYPPKDLLSSSAFIRESEAARDTFIGRLQKIEAGREFAVLFGCLRTHERGSGHGLCNSAVLVRSSAHGAGNGISFFDKTLLPSYDVFDEFRYFDPRCKTAPISFSFKTRVFAVTICEDLWYNAGTADFFRYAEDPLAHTPDRFDAILNLSASPFQLGKYEERLSAFAVAAQKRGAPVVHVNQTGGNDDLIFDGRSFVLGCDGKVISIAASFAEDLLLFDLPPAGVSNSANSSSAASPGNSAKIGAVKHEEPMELLHKGLVLGLKDYAVKNGFAQAILGLSGGIDSAVTAVLAAEAFGAENVLALTMHSKFSSSGSVSDSFALAGNLGITCKTVEIDPLYREFNAALGEGFGDEHFGVAEENLQARIRGVLLMAFSNKGRRLLLSTGNKSELAVGYCTLYGDMNGGLAVLGDVPKTMVYKLAYHLNKNREIIPVSILTKEPSAELRPNQKDGDTLPPYAELDKIVELAVEQHLSLGEIVSLGCDQQKAAAILQKISLNEYKRYQSAPILKVTGKAFGSGRRIPLSKKWEVR